MEYTFHEVASVFPLMLDEAFAGLCEDIKQHGQIEPIWIYDNKILDGRNRYNVCKKLGIEPQILEWKGEEKDLVPFVISLNLHRRHLNESQRAMVASTLANISHGGDRKLNQEANLPNKISQAEAAQLLNVSERSLKTAKQVQHNAIPDLTEKVTQGNIAVSTAALVAKLPKEEQEEIVARGEEEICKAAKAIRAKKAEEKKNDPDIPIESNREKTVSAWGQLVDKMGILLLSANSEATIELAVENLTMRERSSFYTSATRLRDHLNQWIEILENKGAVNYDAK